jgi:hypothetical protein
MFGPHFGRFFTHLVTLISYLLIRAPTYLRKGGLFDAGGITVTKVTTRKPELRRFYIIHKENYFPIIPKQNIFFWESPQNIPNSNKNDEMSINLPTFFIARHSKN